MDHQDSVSCHPKTPCRDCPFRSDVDFELTAGRAKVVVEALQADGDFPCHNTTAPTGHSQSQQKGCIGAAIFLEHVRDGGLRANRMFRMRELWFKEFHRDTLDTDAPVFTSEADFLAARAAESS